MLQSPVHAHLPATFVDTIKYQNGMLHNSLQIADLRVRKHREQLLPHFRSDVVGGVGVIGQAEKRSDQLEYFSAASPGTITGHSNIPELQTATHLRFETLLFGSTAKSFSHVFEVMLPLRPMLKEAGKG